MKSLPIIFFFLLLISGDVSAKDLFPIVASEITDTVVHGETCIGYVEFRNNSSEPVFIVSVSAAISTFRPDYSRNPIVPGRTGRIDYIFDTKQRSGYQQRNIQVMFSNDSIANFPVKYFIKPIEDTLCPCHSGTPEYPGGMQLFTDSLVKITKRQVKPDTTGRCYIRFTVNKGGTLSNPSVLRSIDPEFEAAMLKNLNKLGRWIPACEDRPFMPKDANEPENEMGHPVDVEIQIPVLIQ